ncbi:Tn3 family transposase [Mesorhizobium qingshengii]|uniref:Tn3 family transposase n=1 Tax=Mesorhizobium qingshengii TaxID=1165689 RepID=UPI00115FA246
MTGGRINIRLIRENWPDVLRLPAGMAAGAVVQSHRFRREARPSRATQNHGACSVSTD